MGEEMAVEVEGSPLEEELGATFRNAMAKMRRGGPAPRAAKRARTSSGGGGADADGDDAAAMPSLAEQLRRWGAPAAVARNLEEKLGVRDLFPMQREAIGRFMASVDNDLCISAPTGSGKTLVFALPVVLALHKRVVQRLRALVVLPTRELAAQCFAVFEALCGGTKVVAASSVGKVAFDVASEDVMRCDLLVCTPGRLMEHLRLTKGFTLQHLQFLVVDEADRLLAQRYHGWLNGVMKDAFNVKSGALETDPKGGLRLSSATCRHMIESNVASHRFDEPPLRRILCSATLTRDPQKLASLKLRRPIFISFAGRQQGNQTAQEAADDANFGPQLFALPETLEQRVLVCEGLDKPLGLLQLLEPLCAAKEPTIVFVASVEATHRLALLLREVLPEAKVGEFSSSLSQARRSALLQQFSDGELGVMVASDVMARGIDLDSLVNVINYDAPASVKTYAHRVGRVARAGRSGRAFTLLRNDQRGWFGGMLAKFRRAAPEEVPYDESLAATRRDAVVAALANMQAAIKAEEKNRRQGRRPARNR